MEYIFSCTRSEGTSVGTVKAKASFLSPTYSSDGLSVTYTVRLLFSKTGTTTVTWYPNGLFQYSKNGGSTWTTLFTLDATSSTGFVTLTNADSWYAIRSTGSGTPIMEKTVTFKVSDDVKIRFYKNAYDQFSVLTANSDSFKSYYKVSLTAQDIASSSGTSDIFPYRVKIYNSGWKDAIPWIYYSGEWHRAIPKIYNSGWKSVIKV